MRISEVQVEGYRCLQSLTVGLDDYTALIGTNGAGKSTVLYALDWFFNGGNLETADVCNTSPEASGAVIAVTVTFDQLSSADRQVLGGYAVGEHAVLRRSWSPTAGEKMIGNAVQGPGFAGVRQAARVDDMKAAYAAVRKAVPDLPDVKVKQQMLTALDNWEVDPANAERLEVVDDAEANHLFGFNGEHTLSRLIRLVLVPAATNLADELGQTSRGSALSALIGALMSTAVQTAKESWEAENADQLAELASSIKRGVTTATQSHANRVSKHLAELVPNASVRFQAEPPAWAIKGEPSITTTVRVDGAHNDVARQGHGVQRAVMIAMLQALVAEVTAGNATADDRAAVAGVAEASASPAPALVICVEEPEIYQHPIRARSFARVLTQLASTGQAQVVIATHSPYFVRPEQFGALRRIALHGGCSSLTQATIQEVATTAAISVDKVRKLALQELPRTLSEGFFADGVIFVEGDTDKVVLEALAERLGTPLDAIGVVVIAIGGKSKLQIPAAMLAGLGVPCYVVADADCEGAARSSRRASDTEEQRQQARQSHQAATDRLLSWLPEVSHPPVVGSLPFSFGDDTVVCDSYCIWGDDLEAELEQWPGFMTALRAHNGGLRTKDALVYRAAVNDADLQDLPASLRALVTAARSLVGRTAGTAAGRAGEGAATVAA